jgi:hypothetical protein
MSTIHDVKLAVAQYESSYRAPNLPRFEVAGLYDLTPALFRKEDVAVESAWPKVWAHNDRQGVYIILDDDLAVLYVGKASFSNLISGRLSCWFTYGPGKECRILHDTWSKRPRFVVTIAVPRDTPFEAPALEEFLITKLQPPDNVIGRNS